MARKIEVGEEVWKIKSNVEGNGEETPHEITLTAFKSSSSILAPLYELVYMPIYYSFTVNTTNEEILEERLNQEIDNLKQKIRVRKNNKEDKEEIENKLEELI